MPSVAGTALAGVTASTNGLVWVTLSTAVKHVVMQFDPNANVPLLGAYCGASAAVVPAWRAEYQVSKAVATSTGEVMPVLQTFNSPLSVSNPGRNHPINPLTLCP